MSHYLKIVMDCIFGEKNFRNELAWCYSNIGAAPKRQFPRKHDIILFYSKDGNNTYNQVFYKHWKSGEDAKPCDWWIDITSFNGFMKPRDDNHYGYPTQKPLALLERIIEASSNVGDIVLDPFCGCATTCVAAESLNRKWVGIDVSHEAYDLVKLRLEEQAPSDLLRQDPKFNTDPPVRTDTGENFVELGSVYVISNTSWKGMYKVGIAKNVASRLNSYQTSDPLRAFKLEFSIETPHYKEVENIVHDVYTGDRLNEWVHGELTDIQNTIEEAVANYET